MTERHVLYFSAKKMVESWDSKSVLIQRAIEHEIDPKSREVAPLYKSELGPCIIGSGFDAKSIKNLKETNSLASRYLSVARDHGIMKDTDKIDDIFLQKLQDMHDNSVRAYKSEQIDNAQSLIKQIDKLINNIRDYVS